MPTVDALPTVSAAILGSLVIVAGFYVQRGGKLRTRQGAAVLANLAAVAGAVVVLCAAVAVLLSARQTAIGIF